ncbi:polysaccharide pyruvyl transferase family protein [Rhodoplanes sp. TEM]|uniref:Polysaccharide pyruvyl transferase family protein n=1 Tax=Rhodoplanes tepidamans TaxID=200616 RepID=A0ABT5JCB8_RHOTP|nr:MULTISPECIES: polysaccharide pyruvyl transferase family protein [Rhodoplanes]MDC7786695.1 polysaccharide pyruvyl transferase family protein [Rhodoplanes tepidamans]MDC7983701.1 polysaccharide pyruvyl transferase family protein [Rhodoplanes sp. TEM]MDQ0358131.1 hypothetical protein [Rhodoplanes tepidamans]
MIGVLAANDGTATNPDIQTSAGLMRVTGRNVGNLAFWYTARRLLDEEVTFVPWKTAGKSLPKGLRAFVIPAANFIGTHSNLAPITEIVRELDLPVVIVGLGAQSERDDVIPPVADNVKEFLVEVSARTPFIGVRGEYSAKVCKALGASNVEVLGCPSVLMNPDRKLGETVAARMKELEPTSIAVHAACRKGNLTSVERELVRLVQLKRGSSYIVQRPPELIAAMYRETLNEQDSAYFGEVATFLGMSVDELRAFLLDYGHVPSSVPSWQVYMKRFSCSINTRIHGTMMAFQSGIPSLCVTHDTRTRELAAKLKLPGLEPSQMIEHRYDIKRMFAATKFDPVAFEVNRAEIAARYRALFAELGLKPSSHLESFVRRPA